MHTIGRLVSGSVILEVTAEDAAALEAARPILERLVEAVGLGLESKARIGTVKAAAKPAPKAAAPKPEPAKAAGATCRFCGKAFSPPRTAPGSTVCPSDECQKAKKREYNAKYNAAHQKAPAKPAAPKVKTVAYPSNRVADALRRANTRIDRGEGIPHDMITGQALRVGSADE